jgi:hypothetical protein
MNQYMMRVGNATIKCEGLNEYSAMQDLAVFNIGDMIGYYTDGADRDVWAYQVEVMGKIQIALITKLRIDD